MIAHFREHGEMSGWGFWMLGVGLLLLLLLIFLAFLAFRGPGSRHVSGPPAPPPSAGASAGPGAAGHGPEAERILAERFARGEIDDEEYQRRLKVLRGPG